MYFIRKYADCWAIHNDNTGKSRRLTEQEEKLLEKDNENMKKPGVCSIYADDFPQIKEKP